MGSGEGVVVGFDHVHSYMSDRARGKTHGFLQMLSQIRIAPDGTISAVPLPPRQTGIVRPTFNPPVVNDGTADRYLTWSGRDPEHLIAHEGQPRQLYGTYTEICDALRTATGREPQFDRPNDIPRNRLGTDGRPRVQAQAARRDGHQGGHRRARAH